VFAAGSPTTTFGDLGLQQVEQPNCTGSFLEGSEDGMVAFRQEFSQSGS
jgi:hypothetical protein